MPTEKHSEYAQLDAGDKRRVQVLAGLLRVAIGLDRRHAGSVRIVRVVVDGDRVVVEPIPGDDADITVEIYAANERSVLLAEALDRDIVVQVAKPVSGGALSS